MNKKLLITFVTLLLILGTMFVIWYQKPCILDIKEEKNYINLVQEMNLDNIDESFLSYIDNNYPGALKEIHDNKDKYNSELWHDITGYSLTVLKDKYNNITYKEKEGNTISFIGDVSLADNYYVAKAYDERNGLNGILSEDVIKYLNSQSLVVANAEFAIGTNGIPTSGKAYTFLANPSRVNIFHEMNVDLVTLANNHIHDYGENVFKESLNIYDKAGISRIGAGNNLDEADDAAYYIINGYKFAFVNANRSEKTILTPGATDTTPGVLRNYDPEYFTSVIEKEKETSDFVIALIHWGAEYSTKIEDVLLETSHMYIDAGADAIVGTHAHVLQGIEMYKEKPIFYNIGNFIFNNKTLDTAVVTFNVLDNMKMEYKFLPALQSNINTKFIYDKDKENLINKVNSWSINCELDKDGNLK